MRRLLRVPLSSYALLIEAAVCLALARLALWIVPFRRLRRMFTRPVSGREFKGAKRERVKAQVAWAIDRTARLLPGETVCFPRGIAAQVMLRRRGIDATLYYGATELPERGWTGHVWVQDGAQGVVGHRDAGAYHILARYPES